LTLSLEAMLRFLLSIIFLVSLLLPLISAYPNIVFNDEGMGENNGYHSFHNKRGLVIPSNAMMLRNFPMLRRV
ncbi:hypothetical protein PENTCL1PPCAC_6272, partial [Pristionchus entomophagus]